MSDTNSNKLWFCTERYWQPIRMYTATIVYAPDLETARVLLNAEFLRCKMDPSCIDYKLEEISLDKPFAMVLHDGGKNS